MIVNPFCPGCVPETDFTRDASITPSWCSVHAPTYEGADDALAGGTAPTGFAEAGGADNKAFCDFLHRGKHDAAC